MSKIGLSVKGMEHSVIIIEAIAIKSHLKDYD